MDCRCGFRTKVLSECEASSYHFYHCAKNTETNEKTLTAIRHPATRSTPNHLLAMQKKSISSSGLVHSRVLIGLLLCAATACFILIPIRSGLAFLHPQAPSNAPQGMLSFGQRGAYQRPSEAATCRHAR